MIIALLAGIFCLSAFADTVDVVKETAISGNSFQSTQTIIVYVDDSLGKQKKFIEDLAVNRIRHLGFAATIRDSLQKFQEEKEPNPIAPKLILTSRCKGDKDRQCSIKLVLFGYEKNGSWYEPRTLYDEDTILRGDSGAEKIIQRALGAKTFKSAVEHALIKRPSFHSKAAGSSTYKTSWYDIDNKGGRFGLGLAFGLPTGFQITGRYWGTPKLPLYVGIGGGYFGSTNRSLNLDLALIADNAGAFRQAIGIWLSGVSERYTDSQFVKDSFGRDIQKTTETVDWVRFYKGVGYTAEWSNLFFQLGAGISDNRLNESEWKVFIRGGYVFTL